MRRLRPVVADVAWSVYPSVCTCDCTSVRHNRESYQTAKLIKVPFRLALEETIYTVGSFMRNSVLGRGPHPHGMGQFGGARASPL